MANPLEVDSTSPPPPVPDAGNALSQTPARQAPPPPSHDQTVAALRHFDAVKAELMKLLRSDALGKSNVKSQIIDSATKLVSERLMPASEAVPLLASVPENPIEQRKWVQQHFENAVMSERAVLAHHAAGFAGQGPMPTPSADSHMDAMASLRAGYGNG